MEYLVRTTGEVTDRKTKSYVVRASSEQEAQEIAEKNFSEDFLITDQITERAIFADPKKRTSKAVTACVLMLIPIALSCIKWAAGHDMISIAPDLISCLYAAILYGAFIVRFKGISRTISSGTDILLGIVIILLLSSFVNIILVDTTIRIFGIWELPVKTNIILIAALVLSWIGLKVISSICFILVGLFALNNILLLNDAMGTIFGPLYIISSVLGIAFYCSVEPAISESKLHITRSAKSALNYAKKDFTEAGRSVGNTARQINKIKDTTDIIAKKDNRDGGGRKNG